MEKNQLAELAAVTRPSALQEVKQTRQLVAELMQTPHYAKMGEAGIFAVVEMAKMLGIPPLHALNGALYHVKGRIEMGSSTMNQLIRQKGHSITKDPKSNDSICILHGKRADNGDTWTASFSMEDARRAGLTGMAWKTYPQDMLFARALSRLARQLYADVIRGCYVEGEIRDGVELQEAHVELVDEVIEGETAHAIDMCLTDYPDVRDAVKAMCHVADIYQIKKSQLEGVRNYVKLQLRKLKGEVIDHCAPAAEPALEDEIAEMDDQEVVEPEELD